MSGAELSREALQGWFAKDLKDELVAAFDRRAQVYLEHRKLYESNKPLREN